MIVNRSPNFDLLMRGFVSSVYSGSLVKVGDTITMINRRSVVGLSVDDVENMLESSTGIVQLVFARKASWL